MTPSGERPRVEELMELVEALIDSAVARESAQWKTMRDIRTVDFRESKQSLERALTALVQERDALKAIQDEQDSLVDSCGTILCRHQINHDRYDGCLYCDRDKLRAELSELEDTLVAERLDTAQIMPELIKLRAENADARELLESVVGHARRYHQCNDGPFDMADNFLAGKPWKEELDDD